MGRGGSKSSNSTIRHEQEEAGGPRSISTPNGNSPPLSPTSQPTERTKVSNLPLNFNRPRPGSLSSSINDSPVSNAFTESTSSSYTTTYSLSQSETFSHSHLDHSNLDPSASHSLHASLSCDGTCATYTAMCETCSIRLIDTRDTRRGSIGRVLAEIRMEEDETEEHDDAKSGGTVDDDWPPFPFRPSTLT